MIHCPNCGNPIRELIEERHMVRFYRIKIEEQTYDDYEEEDEEGAPILYYCGYCEHQLERRVAMEALAYDKRNDNPNVISNY